MSARSRDFSLAAWWFGILTLAGCAEGYGPDGLLRVHSVADADAGVTAAQGASASVQTHADRDAPGADATTDGRWPCDMGEVAPCVCADTGTEGESVCVFSETSPQDGYFGDCGACRESADSGMTDAGGGPCNDGEKNGVESDTDCGGPACPACPEGGACVIASDCVQGTCVGNVCGTGTTSPDTTSPSTTPPTTMPPTSSGLICGGVPCPACPETEACCRNEATCGCLGPAGLICRT